ncbi:MAG: SH3 domain-containing protein, partial [Deltaproteobacteria bacterium]|nr:SH3 domain-containing protein [Deltaproteobacteria bacterium]
HDGAEFKIIKQDEGWIKIELKDGKRGWVESKWIGKCQLQYWLFSVDK